MACASSCCGGPSSVAAPVPSPILNETKDTCCNSDGSEAGDLDRCGKEEDCCDDACCGGQQDEKPKPEAAPCQDVCRPLKPTSEGDYTKGCGGGKMETSLMDAPDCCASKPTKSGCKRGCCSELAPPKEDLKTPSCCNGKPSPCCDASCLDRIALRECDGTKRKMARISSLALHVLTNYLQASPSRAQVPSVGDTRVENRVDTTLASPTRNMRPPWRLLDASAEPCWLWDKNPAALLSSAHSSKGGDARETQCLRALLPSTLVARRAQAVSGRRGPDRRKVAARLLSRIPPVSIHAPTPAAPRRRLRF